MAAAAGAAGLGRAAGRALPVSALLLPARSCGHAAGWDRRERSYWRALRRRVLGPPVPPFSAPVQVGAPVLRGAAAAVSPEQLGGPELRRLAEALAAGLRARPCLGLSAPQLGVPLRVFAAELPPARCARYPPALRQAHRIEPFPLRVLVNPALRVLDSRLVSAPEGCASIHGFSAYVPRHWAVHVSGTDRPALPGAGPRACPSLSRFPSLTLVTVSPRHPPLNSLMGPCSLTDPTPLSWVPILSQISPHTGPSLSHGSPFFPFNPSLPRLQAWTSSGSR